MENYYNFYMDEAKMQSLVTGYCKKHPIDSCVAELKITKGKSLPYSRLEGHQETALIKSSNDRGKIFKLTDLDPRLKPFDMTVWRRLPAYVVIMFYVPRKPKITYWIPIEKWTHYRDNVSTRKSITEEEAKKISTRKLII